MANIPKFNPLARVRTDQVREAEFDAPNDLPEFVTVSTDTVKSVKENNTLSFRIEIYFLDGVDWRLYVAFGTGFGVNKGKGGAATEEAFTKFSAWPLSGKRIRVRIIPISGVANIGLSVEAV